MSQLTLYTNPQSRGRIAHWMLEELGQPYDTVVGLRPRHAHAGVFGAQPMGKVPVLKHGEVVVTEAPALCAYLADAFPKPSSPLPAGSPAIAAYYRWLFFTAGPLEMATTARALSWDVPEGKSGMVGFGSYRRTLDAVETALQQGPHVWRAIHRSRCLTWARR